MMRSLRNMALFAAAVMLSAGTAAATIVRQLSLPQMAERADVIVHGTVIAQSADWNPEHTRIYTVTSLQVTESLKGAAVPGSTLQVRQLGGIAGGVVQTIPGNAVLRPGEELVIFLTKDKTLPLHYVVGMAQGKFSVSRTASGAQVDRDLHDLALLPPGTMPGAPGGLIEGSVGAAEAAARPVSGLDELKARIRAALASTGH